MLLAHPEPETLGRFVEGTLDDPERAAIVQHIADCDECRILVVDAAELTEPAKIERHKWWMGVAASLMLVAVIGPVPLNEAVPRVVAPSLKVTVPVGDFTLLPVTVPVKVTVSP